jgi:hypothetical protein
MVIWMGPLAEAQARPHPQGSLSALYHCLDLWAVERLGQRVRRRPQALQGIRYGLSNPPADLSQGVG